MSSLYAKSKTKSIFCKNIFAFSLTHRFKRV
nr:MAG TPA: hypothetical protein [Caudoviricetes sp.]